MPGALDDDCDPIFSARTGVNHLVAGDLISSNLISRDIPVDQISNIVRMDCNAARHIGQRTDSLGCKGAKLGAQFRQ
jgi:hypothetical protein